MEWGFEVDDRGLVWVSPKGDCPAFRETLNDSVSALAPRGQKPELSTWWIDRVLERLDAEPRGSGEQVVAQGNSTALIQAGDTVRAEPLYQTFDVETMPVAELVRGLGEWRKAVLARLGDNGPRLASDAGNYQRNPF